jgi:hypothetical protein
MSRRVCFPVGVTDLELAARVLSTWDFADPAGSLARFIAAADAEPDRDRRLVLLTQAARANGLAGDFAAGDELLDTLGVLDELAAEPAVRCLLERGRLRNSSGEEILAAPLFQAAYDRALAAGLLGLAADSAHMLAIVLPADEQERWARRGLELTARPGAYNDPLAPRMRAALLNNLAWTHADADRWAEALPLFEEAVELRRLAGVAEPLLAARWARARALRALGRYTEALAEQRELATLPEGADDKYVADEIAANEEALLSAARPITDS